MGKVITETLGPEWAEALGRELSKEYMAQIAARIVMLGNKVRPAVDYLFNAYRSTQPSQVKVVIVGQDPYPGNEAHGLAFSSRLQSIPPSLRVIFGELERSGYGKRTNPNLQDWADQGVFLLNSVLSTTYRITNAHSSWGWQKFTQLTLRHLNTQGQDIVYMVWGGSALSVVEKSLDMRASGDKSIVPARRLQLNACHPQAENYGKKQFTGCNHFVMADHFLKDNAIKWV